MVTAVSRGIVGRSCCKKLMNSVFELLIIGTLGIGPRLQGFVNTFPPCDAGVLAYVAVVVVNAKIVAEINSERMILFSKTILVTTSM